MIPKSQPTNRYPGDRAAKLLEAATDDRGRKWPAGTIIGCWLCGGGDGTGGRYATATIDAQTTITFRSRT